MIGAKIQRPGPACIQLWGLQSKRMSGSQANDSYGGELKCEMVLCLESGPAFEIKWCPLPSHDRVCLLTSPTPSHFADGGSTVEWSSYEWTPSKVRPTSRVI